MSQFKHLPKANLGPKIKYTNKMWPVAIKGNCCGTYSEMATADLPQFKVVDHKNESHQDN